MVRALRYAAFSLLLTGSAAASGEFNDLLMTGVELTATSGTTVLQNVTADTARLSGDGSRVLADRIRLSSRLKGGQSVVAEAPRGEICVGAVKPMGEVRTPPYEVVRDYGIHFAEYSSKGDLILLADEGDRVIARIQERGTIAGSSLIWSKILGRFIVPTKFEQNATPESGATVTITGAALVSDQEFLSWTYYQDGSTPVTISYTAPAAATDSQGN